MVEGICCLFWQYAGNHRAVNVKPGRGDSMAESWNRSDEFQVPGLKFKEAGKKLRALIGIGSHAKVAKSAKGLSLNLRGMR